MFDSWAASHTNRLPEIILEEGAQDLKSQSYATDKIGAVDIGLISSRLTAGERVEALEPSLFCPASRNIETEEEWKLEHDDGICESSYMDEDWEASKFRQSQSFEELQHHHKHLSLLPQLNGSYGSCSWDYLIEPCAVL